MPLPADRMEVKTAGLVAARVRATEIGDTNLARSITADLARLGYREPPLETTEAPGMPEVAVPAKRRGRPPKIRPEEVEGAEDESA